MGDSDEVVVVALRILLMEVTTVVAVVVVMGYLTKRNECQKQNALIANEIIATLACFLFRFVKTAVIRC